jgi:hypothetical protein
VAFDDFVQAGFEGGAGLAGGAVIIIERRVGLSEEAEDRGEKSEAPERAQTEG